MHPWPALALLALLSCTDRKAPQQAAVAPIPAPDSLRPVWGHRFVVRGDFDGDGRPDTLTERYISRRTGAETNKGYAGIRYDALVERTIAKEPAVALVSPNGTVDSLPLAAKDQLLGIAWLKNEGDLDGDGGDELSCVLDWADWSSLNTCRIYSFRGRTWRLVQDFPIWEWQLPEALGTETQYGPFGTVDKQMREGAADTAAPSGGLIRKVAPGRIRVRMRSAEGEEVERLLPVPAPGRRRG